MLSITKIFHFEMAHAIHGYEGPCKDIHGHSYELHVSVSAPIQGMDFIPEPGFIIDFKDIKRIVNQSIIQCFDHRLVLSASFLEKHPTCAGLQNLVTWKAEPTVENLLLFIKNHLEKELPAGVLLSHLKLYETNNSYAEWHYTVAPTK